MYFTLLGSLHCARLGKDICCVPFGSGSRFCLHRNIFCLCIRCGTVRLREPVLCLKHNLLCLQSGAAWLREPVLFGTNRFVHMVRDRSAPGAGFCLKLSISVHGPGPFGSGSLFCLERDIVFAVWDPSAPGAGVGHKYGPGPFRSGNRFVFGRKLFVNTVWDPFGSGSRFYSAKLLYGLKPLVWLWHIVDSGSFGFGGQK